MRHFDCASLAEVALVRQMFPDAAIHFMHPVKSRGAIREAWARHGVRDFVLDSADELAKILHEIAATGVPGDLGLFVRLALPKGDAVLDLSGKFGARAGRGGGAAARGAAACQRGSASASMSARNASTRWPGATRWRWPAR